MLKAFGAELHPEWVPRPGSSPLQRVLWESLGACRAWDRLGATLLSRGATFLHPPAFLVAQWERICLPRQEAQVRPLSREDPLEEETATPSSIVGNPTDRAWRVTIQGVAKTSGTT